LFNPVFRRLSVLFLRRAFIVLALLCLGCSAQLTAPEVSQRIQRQLRATYSVPPAVQIAIGPRTPSEFPNYDKITVSFTNGPQKQNHDFLLSKDGKTLVRFTKLDLTSDPYADVMKKIDTAGRPMRGNKDAKVTIVNYDDFECPFCSRMHQTLFPGIFDQYKDQVRIIYKDYPLSEIHPWATHAAVDANCLAAQNNDAYWDFADYVHANQKDISGGERGNLKPQTDKLDQLTLQQGQKHNLDLPRLQACVKAQNEEAVQASVREANGLGVSATPTMFINGEKLDGAVPPQELRAAVDRALKDAGVRQASEPAGPAAPKPASGPTGK
jgi:protein-disulfide isomerase